MSGYLVNESLLSIQASAIVPPPESEIQAAYSVLSHSPVNGYVGFTELSVRILGAYREFLSPRGLIGRIDECWATIVQGEWYAWIIALHEIREIDFFSQRGIDPFDMALWRQHWEEAHLQATLFELQYLRDWAKQLGEDIPEMALLREHPLRQQFPHSHTRDIRAAQQSQGWSEPSPEELLRSRQIWSQRGKL